MVAVRHLPAPVVREENQALYARLPMDMKVVRRAGHSATHPGDGDRVWCAYLVDNQPERPFASCEIGEDPFSIVLGQEQTIVGLEALLKTMSEGEVASVKLPPDQCFGAGGNPHKFHGRGEPIPPHATLIFEVQLVWFEATTELSRRSTAPLAERFAFATERKAQANDSFKAGFIPKALIFYSQCAALIDESPEPAYRELLVQLHANIAACKVKVSRWKEVIAHCDIALKYDSKHSKSLFRRGRAYLSTGKYDEARKDLKQAAELEPNDKEVQSELARLEGLLSRIQQQEKSFAQNIVQGIMATEGPLVPERPPDPEEQFAKCNICGAKVEKVQLARHVIKMHSSKDA